MKVKIMADEPMPGSKSVFVSYHFHQDEMFIARVRYFLLKQGISVYFYAESPIIIASQGWRIEIGRKLTEASALLFFCGSKFGDTQMSELQEARSLGKPIIFVELPGGQRAPDLQSCPACVIDLKNKTALDENVASICAKQCCFHLKQPWITEDDIPDGYPFDYEKAIIDAYLKDKIDLNFVSQGCPEKWPRVKRKDPSFANPVSADEIGRYRDVDDGNNHETKDPEVFVAAISDFPPEGLRRRGMVLSLAGPRSQLHFNPYDRPNPFRVGVLVSGGIAPGTNAVISALFQRHNLYAAKGGYRVQVLGYYDGFQGLLSPVQPPPLDSHILEGTFNQAGSIIGTSRLPAFVDDDRKVRDDALQEAVTKLIVDDVKILYVIGGDGSMRAAHVLCKRIDEARRDISVVAIPKTMDNDVLWGWQTFGFESAVEKANEIIHQLHVEAESNPRLGILQLFGSDSGYVVTHAALASGLCDLFLIPEVPFSMRRVWEYVSGKLQNNAMESIDHGSHAYRSHGLILMAEAAVPVDASWYLDSRDLALTDDEKSEARQYLRLEYWDNQTPLKLPEDSKRRIRKYLGVDQEGGFESVPTLDRAEKGYVREYARFLRTKGQTPDGLRSAGLKLVSGVLQERFRKDTGRLPVDYWRDFRVFTNEPRHAIRAVAPTSSDILFGHRLGTLAVDGAMAGYTDFMISQWLTEYVMVPLRLVDLGRKRVPEKGIFYRSALASTGQPADLI
ncbi:MAG: 6-phosphofructokinase [Verrucomicrobia bacterium]|nr:6-phosphofructokinase [Verrucomicrobiota bacterium]